MIRIISKINCKKVTAIAVINCFLFSFVYGNVIAEVSANVQSGKQFAQIFSNFILPYSYGKITETNITNSPRVVIQIQDLHCHPQVQKNIANIIEVVDKKMNNGLNTVYLEGAFGDVDTGWLKECGVWSVKSGVNDKTADFAVLDKILQTGRLTGAEYYSAISGKYNMIKGLESKDEYLDNLERFGDILGKQDEIQAVLKGIEESTQGLKERYYNRKQIKIENLFKSYSKQEINARKYYVLLSKYADHLGVDINKYENTSLYINLLHKEKELDYKKVSQELSLLLLKLKEVLPYQAYSLIVKNTSNLSETDKLYMYLIKFSKEFKIDLDVNFPELNKFFAYVETSQKINPIELIGEEEKFRNEINSRFADTKAQREVVFLIDFEKYLKEYLASKISFGNYEYYKANMETYRKLWVKYVDNRVLSLLDDYIKEADKFYDINVDRNKYFARQLKINNEQLTINGENLLSVIARKDEVLPKQSSVVASVEPSHLAGEGLAKQAGEGLSLDELLNNLNNKQVEIVITGGFHTEGVSKILKDNGISYIVITPNVTSGVKEAEEVYYKIAKLQSEELSKNPSSLISANTNQASVSSDVTEGINRESSANSFKSSTLANLILTLDAESRTAFINALQTGQDISKIDAGKLFDRAQKAQEIIKLVRGAQLLESDDNGEIMSAITKTIEDNLPDNSSYKGKVTSELLEKLDLDKVREALDGNIASLESILETAKFRQESPNELSLQLKLIAEHLKQFTKKLLIFDNNAELEKVGDASAVRIVQSFRGLMGQAVDEKTTVSEERDFIKDLLSLIPAENAIASEELAKEISVSDKVSIRKLLTAEEKPYFDVLVAAGEQNESQRESELSDIANNVQADIQVRLYALLFLKYFQTKDDMDAYRKWLIGEGVPLPKISEK
ncbi:MAG: hypothetical protein FWC57_04680, partial [Endomicrobia bacterium]|nr:hypothetical protein [Endomicrobiia bacterium]